MQFDVSFIYHMPFWPVGLVFMFVLLSVLEAGYQIGYKQREHWKAVETNGGRVVLTALLALLGLLLAFTYSASSQRYEARKHSVIMEANTLGTAFLRADLVQEPQRSELKQALLDYAHTRVSESNFREVLLRVDELLEETLNRQKRLWDISIKIINEGDRGPVDTALLTAINEVIDIHTIRIAVKFDKLPLAVTMMMLLVAAASLGIAGFNAGINGKMSRWRMTVFALVLTLIMLVIHDFDRPREGMIRTPVHSLQFLILEMEAELAN